MTAGSIQVVLNGAAGRMGLALIEAITEAPGMELRGALERPGHPELGRDAGELAGVGPLGVALTAEVGEALAPGSVVVDFSTPEGLTRLLEVLPGEAAALVTGVTGLGADEESGLVRLAASMPAVVAPNMSPGINLLYGLLTQALEALGEEYDVEIMEVHHRLKRDAPSGTALKLAEVAATARRDEPSERILLGRSGLTGPRPRREIGVHALRGGDVVGEHTVMLSGPGERIELSHRAQSRAPLVRGTLLAITWIVGKGPRLYSMQDVLGL